MRSDFIGTAGPGNLRDSTGTLTRDDETDHHAQQYLYVIFHSTIFSVNVKHTHTKKNKKRRTKKNKTRKLRLVYVYDKKS